MAEASRTLFPQTAEELTADWIGFVLSERWPGVSVLSMEILDQFLGTSLKMRVSLQYNEIGKVAGLPATMIVKGPFGRQSPEIDFVFKDEMHAYRDLISHIGLNTPKCFYAGQEGRNPLMLLEDLTSSDCTFGSPFIPLSFDKVANLLDSVARLHAHYWDSPELADDGPLGWVTRSVTGPHLDHYRHELSPERWSFYRTLPRAAGLPYSLVSDPARIERAMDMQWASHRLGPLTLGHGDCHVANTYFNAKGGGLLDWQLRRSPWYHDVSYLITSSLDIVDRRRWEAALLQHYLGRLTELGVRAPQFDEAWRCHRREQIYGYITFVTNGDGTQYWTEAANTICALRFAMAAEDLHTIEAIESE